VATTAVRGHLTVTAAGRWCGEACEGGGSQRAFVCMCIGIQTQPGRAPATLYVDCPFLAIVTCDRPVPYQLNVEL
jgi:hypothetical protein